MTKPISIIIALAFALGSVTAACGSGSKAGGVSGTGGAFGTGGVSGAATQTCGDNLKALGLGSRATITLVKAFKSGDALSLVIPAAAGSITARADVCLVKMIVGPGSPGPARAPSTSAGIGIEVLLPAPAAWNERYQAF